MYACVHWCTCALIDCLWKAVNRDDALPGLGLGHIAICDLEQRRCVWLFEEVPT